jgi:hypothetical protein
VPIRAIAETLGFEVQWNGSTNTVRLQKNTKNVELVIGQQTARRNGAPFELDVPALIMNQRTMVPVRFIAEALGYDVEWKEQVQIVQITDALPAPESNPPSPQPPQTDEPSDVV